MRRLVFYKAIFIVCLLVCALAISCDQEPLFWEIAHEYPPIKPRIKGAPTKIVKANSKLYISNGARVWEYENPTIGWKTFTPAPENRTIDLAAVNNDLYALDDKGNIRKYDLGGTWNLLALGDVGKIEKIFGVGNYLFASTRIGSPGTKTGYNILVIDSSDAIIGNKPDTALLMGVVEVSGIFYLGTLGDGLYSWNGSTLTGPIPDFPDTILGLAEASSILYISTSRSILSWNGAGGPTQITGTANNIYTGAIAIWKDPSPGVSEFLLLVGIKNSNTTNNYGYREIVLDSSGVPVSVSGSVLRIPGNNDTTHPTSVERSSEYISAIGKLVINFLWVVDSSLVDSGDNETRPLIFASTAKDGLWSYKVRDGEPQWNGEY